MLLYHKERPGCVWRESPLGAHWMARDGAEGFKGGLVRRLSSSVCPPPLRPVFPPHRGPVHLEEFSLIS